MLVTLVIIIVVLIAALLAYAGTRPNSFRIERSTSIKAAPATVYALIEDFHRWGGWSPWEKLDPALNRSFSGSPSGKGSIYEWQGNNKVGQGRMEIVESVPTSKVAIKLPPPPPKGAGEIEKLLLRVADTVAFGRASVKDGAQQFHSEAESILARA